eukprot:COSAG01_NODE_2616_length_7374_cov_8.288031_3_plen_225_part_00
MRSMVPCFWGARAGGVRVSRQRHTPSTAMRPARRRRRHRRQSARETRGWSRPMADGKPPPPPATPRYRAYRAHLVRTQQRAHELRLAPAQPLRLPARAVRGPPLLLRVPLRRRELRSAADRPQTPGQSAAAHIATGTHSWGGTHVWIVAGRLRQAPAMGHHVATTTVTTKPSSPGQTWSSSACFSARSAAARCVAASAAEATLPLASASARRTCKDGHTMSRNV